MMDRHAEDRLIAHVDMDAFFAAVEQLDNPALRGKPILVGSDKPRGVVTTASYEARPFGCHSAQPMAVAKRLCPNAIIVPVRGHRYREISQQVFRIFDDFSPLVQPLSIDEAFLDMTGSERLLGSPHDIGQAIRKRVVDATGLTASVGLAPNKFLAKLASEINKPDGMTIITRDEVQHVLSPLPLSKLWGVGPATLQRFERLGLHTIGDIAAQSREWLQRYFGDDGAHFHRLAHGIDDRPVTADRQAKSIGHETTFEADIDDAEEVRRVLFRLVEQIGHRLRKHSLAARTVSVKIRYGDFETITRSATLDQASDATEVIWHAVIALFDRWAHSGFRPVRLIGASTSQLAHAGGEQLDLFAGEQQDQQRRVDKVSDLIATKFGKKAIRRGRGLDKPASDEHSPAE